MIGWAGHRTQTPSSTSLQPIKWNANFWIMFNFWWSAGLVDGLEPHPPPFSNQKNEMLIFGLRSTSYDWPGWSMDSNPICHPSPTKKMKCSFLDYIQLLMIGQAGRRTPTPSATSFQPKNEMLVFVLRYSSDHQPGWSMDSNPIHHPSPPKKMKCSFLDYVELLIVGWAGQWTQTPSTSPLKPKKWNACFWIMFHFWWLARLVDGLKPHLLPLSSQKMKCSYLDYFQFRVISQTGRWTQTPAATPLQPKNEMVIFGLRSTSDDRSGWSMDSNPICHPSPAKKMKCSFLDYVELLIVGWAGQWTRTQSTSCLQPRNEMLILELHSTSDDWQGWSMDSSPIHHPSPAKKMKCSFLDYVQLLMIGQIGQWTQTPAATPLQPKNEMLIFGLHSISGDQPGWSMDSNPICHPSPATKMKCSFLDYVQLLMISQAGQRTLTPSATSFQPKNEMLVFVLCYSSDHQPGWSMDSTPIHHPSSQKNEMLIFLLCSTSDDWPGWLMDSNQIHYPSPAKKMKCSFLYYIQLLMIGWAGHWTWTPSTSTLKPKKMKCSFLDYD